MQYLPIFVYNPGFNFDIFFKYPKNNVFKIYLKKKKNSVSF